MCEKRNREDTQQGNLQQVNTILINGYSSSWTSGGLNAKSSNVHLKSAINLGWEKALPFSLNTEYLKLEKSEICISVINFPSQKQFGLQK